MLSLRLALRNLGRNRARTMLGASAIAFAVMLLAFTTCFQTGQYDLMISNGTRMMNGHVQIAHYDFKDEPSLRHSIEDAASLTERLATMPGVAGVLTRSMTSVLVSAEARSFGAQLIAVEPAAEAALTTLPKFVTRGRYLDPQADDEVVLGKLLARNLGAEPGDEIVVLGSGRQGDSAALALNVVGLLETGQAAADRSLMFMPLTAFAREFDMVDRASQVVVMADTAQQGEAMAARWSAHPEELGFDATTMPRIQGWREVMPELIQAIESDRGGGIVMFLILVAVVTFGIVNTFIMIVFERTQEFGVLLAIGATPGRVRRMLHVESAVMCVIGVALGVVLALVLVSWLAQTGISLGQEAADLAQRFHLDPRMYPVYDWRGFVYSGVLLFVATQFAVYLPGRRLKRLDPVEALRDV